MPHTWALGTLKRSQYERTPEVPKAVDGTCRKQKGAVDGCAFDS